jgi:hypothetical protein
VTKTLITWFGIIGPLMFSLISYQHQKAIEAAAEHERLVAQLHEKEREAKADEEKARNEQREKERDAQATRERLVRDSHRRSVRRKRRLLIVRLKRGCSVRRK